jgi:toxin YoeB
MDFWEKNSPAKCKKIARLIVETACAPFTGTGKPEPLKHDYSGCWSRRIDREHRLVYRVEEKALIILSCRFHYDE